MRDALVLFSSIPYDFLYQRPQALAQKLSRRGVDVYYVEGVFRRGSLNASRPGYRHDHAIRRIDGHLCVVSVSRYFDVLGVPFRLGRDRMERHIGAWLRALLRDIGADRPVTGFFEGVTWWWDHVRDFPFSRVCYDFIDDAAVFGEHIEADRNRRLLHELLEHSDHVFVTARKLEEHLAPYRDRTQVLRVPNGVLFERFQSPRPHPEVQALRSTYPTVCGYVGYIHTWTDTALVAHCARALPEVAFVLVGPATEGVVDELRTLPNVRLLGGRPHEQMPDFIHSFDVCLIPFVLNEISASTDPIKVYEYLACGKPVVSTDIHELRPLDGLVYLARDREDFVARIRVAAGENDPDLVARRREYARMNSWDHRADMILAALEAPSAPRPARP